MFGYIVANRESLSQEELARYRGFYCGVCDTLKRQYGLNGRMVLTYDMAFLALLLSSLYEPETRERRGVCVAHPKKEQLYLTNEFVSYAADMNIALAYYKCLDDVRDDASLAAKTESKLLLRHMPQIEARHRAQCDCIREKLKELSELEKSASSGADACAAAFGAITERIFRYREDAWAEDMGAAGMALGKFIYIMDAYDDLEKDVKKGAFNPLAPIFGTDGFEETAYDMLTMLMGECTMAFERLPLEQDLSILRNILYSGVWTKYNAIQDKKSKGKESLT